MRKGVADTWRYYQVGTGANNRYLDALAQASVKRESFDTLDALRRVPGAERTWHLPPGPPRRRGRTVRRRPRRPAHLNRAAPPRPDSPPCTRTRPRPDEQRRRCPRTSRQIAKLRGHGLLAKVKAARLYRPTPKGLRLMTAAVQIRQHDFPAAYAIAPAA